MQAHVTTATSIALMFAIVILLASCGEEEEKADQTPPPSPPTVSAYEVEEKEIPIVMEFSGTLKAVRKVQIVPRVTGYVSEIYFDEGSNVREGDPLYLIDPRPYEEALANYQAERENHEASLNYWETEVKRFSTLVKKQVAAQQKLDETIANRDKFRALVKEDDARINNAKLTLGFTHINAPFDGRMQQTLVHLGANVTEQQDVMTEIVQLDPIQVIFNVSRTESFYVQQLSARGMAYPVDKMIVEVLLPDGTVYKEKGRIDFVGTQIDPTTDSMIARGTFQKSDASKGVFDLLPGQYVPVRVTVGAIPNALVVPQESIMETQEGSFVYLIGQDKKIERRKVEPGRAHAQLRVIEKGLNKGDKVVVEGVQKVKAGMAVMLKK